VSGIKDPASIALLCLGSQTIWLVLCNKLEKLAHKDLIAARVSFEQRCQTTSGRNFCMFLCFPPNFHCCKLTCTYTCTQVGCRASSQLLDSVFFRCSSALCAEAEGYPQDCGRQLRTHGPHSRCGRDRHQAWVEGGHEDHVSWHTKSYTRTVRTIKNTYYRKCMPLVMLTCILVYLIAECDLIA